MPGRAEDTTLHAVPSTSRLALAEPTRKVAAMLLHDAASKQLADLEVQHHLERSRLPASSKAAANSKAADRSRAEPSAFANACASMWEPLLRKRAGDCVYESKKFSKEELAFKDHGRANRA